MHTQNDIFLERDVDGWIFFPLWMPEWSHLTSIFLLPILANVIVINAYSRESPISRNWRHTCTRAEHCILSFFINSCTAHCSSLLKKVCIGSYLDDWVDFLGICRCTSNVCNVEHEMEGRGDCDLSCLIRIFVGVGRQARSLALLSLSVTW